MAGAYNNATDVIEQENTTDVFFLSDVETVFRLQNKHSSSIAGYFIGTGSAPSAIV